MAFFVILAIALVPALAILLAPKHVLKPVAAVAGVVFALVVIWAISFGNSCASDGCIGVFLIGGLAALIGGLSAIAGLVRWAVMAWQRRKETDVAYLFS